ncbi:hypothetical protein K8I28_04945, partial [bacterium]|nr:hypothetical protein [bacterium]
MPEHMTAKGNWPLRILVVILAVFLISSILYPKKLWNEQDKLIELSQDRMENLNFVVQRYKKVNDRYSANMDSLLTFFRQDSIQVDRPLFEFERLSLYDAENDCMLVGFLDRFHYDSIAVKQVQP